MASASILWKGDFETGNTSQWTRLQTVANDRLLVVSDVVRDGKYSVKATVKKGDDPINASGNRNELLYLSLETPGVEYFYKWSTLFPSDYPSSKKWQVFAQWHQMGCCGSPPLEFYVVGEEMRLRVGGSSGKILWSAPLVRGKWNDFVLQVKWSPDPKVGYVALYKDGKPVVPKTMAATQFGDEKNYLKLGLYRDASISQTASVYHDGFTMASRLEDVLPAQVAAPAPQPAPAPVVPTVNEPAPVIPPVVNTAPAVESSPNYTTLPGDEREGELEYGGPQGCGASASGGLPLVAAMGLLGVTLLTRRRQALARVRAQKR
jgi:hypothetical protein